MFKLTDTAKISIIVTAFCTLIIMITCILYKLSKLREVMERMTSEASADLGTTDLPRRGDSCASSENSEGSVSERFRERSKNKSMDDVGGRIRERSLENTADQSDTVFTGRLTMNSQYKSSSQTLILRNVVAEDLLPWNYSCSAWTYVLMDFKIGKITEQRKTVPVQGIHKACYKQEFAFKLSETDLSHAELSVSVWEVNEQVEDSLLGECSISLETMKLPMPGTNAESGVDISTNVFKRVNRKLEAEILVSLSYLPTAERLSVVVMKAKNIEITKEESITCNHTTIPNPFVKVCLIYAGRKIKKKKTSVKRNEKNPVYNESMIFDVPGKFLHKIGFLITIEHRNFETEQTTVLGRVVMGSPVQNHSLRHWNQMLAFPRRAVAGWHKVFYLG